jgi:hypothetical protein
MGFADTFAHSAAERPVTTTQSTTGQSIGPMASIAALKLPDAIVAYSPIVKNA